MEPISAIALGLAGNSLEAGRLADDLNTRFPRDTIMQSVYVPMIRAAGILGTIRNPTEADKAVQSLAATAPYELGTLPVDSRFALYPVYLRG